MHNVYIYNNLYMYGYLERKEKDLKSIYKGQKTFGILSDIGILIFDKPGGRECKYVAVTSDT